MIPPGCTTSTSASSFRWILLPGLDGTGLLFDPLWRALPKNIPACITSYPCQPPYPYLDLVETTLNSLLIDEPHVLIAESFSGPIAIKIAAAAPSRVKALVLCASFATSPVNPFFATILLMLTGGFLSRMRPPEWLVRRYLLGNDAPNNLIKILYQALSLVPPPVLLDRLYSVLSVNVLPDLASLKIPVLYICASHDKVVGPRSLRTIQKWFPKVQVETVDAPHLVLQREPKQCIKIIQRFLEQTTDDER